jgi:hypothetical protein
MKADIMNEKTIELSPLPEPAAYIDQSGECFPQLQGDVFTADQMHAYLLTDRASRSRAASEPGEVARLAEEVRDELRSAIALAKKDSRDGVSIALSAKSLLFVNDRLASAATSPASEALTPQQREDILVKAGAICDGGMSHDDFGLEIIDQVERHYGICAHGAGSISKS